MMTTPSPFLAHSLVNLRREIDERYPTRSTVSDGWIGDAAHASGITDLNHDGKVDAWDAALKSQHNPDGNGCVHAIDITTDGVEPDNLITHFQRHPAAWYVIFNRRIWSRTHNWEPRPYQGPDPHTGHLHFSILLTHAAETSDVPWGVYVPVVTTPEEPDVKPILCKTDTDPHHYAVYLASGFKAYIPDPATVLEWCKYQGVSPQPVIVSQNFLNLFPTLHA